MRRRVFAAAGLATAALAFALAAPAAHAATGPPPPVSTNGQPVELVASGLMTPTSLAGGDGQVFEGDGGNSTGSAPPNGGVYVLENGQAVRIHSSITFVAGLAFHDGRLYISGGMLVGRAFSWRLWSWGGWNGTTFTSRRTLYTGGAAFDGFNGLGFGADGRLYVGVDVGYTNGNDHGPASTSPYLYDILTFNADGTDPQVFAKGIRQPWQLAFQPGSDEPYVTDLGADAGVKNPPDFLLHARAGDNYDFPACEAKKGCAGFTKPYRTFTPHTDLMGIAIQCDTAYLSSFEGTQGKGPGGEVLTLSLHGSSGLKPLLAGFVAPTVGLTLINGYVYVGELTGQVFRLKV